MGCLDRFPENTRKPVQAVVYEFLQTTHQSGPEHVLGELTGNDNYFNHGNTGPAGPITAIP
jgi:hypothetical protein